MTTWPEIVTVFVGSALGVLTVKFVATDVLKQVMPCCWWRWRFILPSRPTSARSFTRAAAARRLQLRVAPVIGFYDGIFGPGTGSFFMLALVALFGVGLIESHRPHQTLNFTSNIAALIMFALRWQNHLDHRPQHGRGAGDGCTTGRPRRIANGAKIIRPLLVVMCIAMAVRLYINA